MSDDDHAGDRGDWEPNLAAQVELAGQDLEQSPAARLFERLVHDAAAEGVSLAGQGELVDEPVAIPSDAHHWDVGTWPDGRPCVISSYWTGAPPG